MQFISYPSRNEWASLLQRPVQDFSQIEQTVAPILQRVKSEGDQALLELTATFDRITLEHLRVGEEAIGAAAHQLSDELKRAIHLAKSNIKKFHAAQRAQPEKIETTPGVICWRESVGIEKVGLYIPGGTAPLFSTVLMLGVPAQLAGCQEVVLCTPANRQGEIHPAILYTAQLVGIHKIFAVGGAQAIAAMAYGTESIPKVHKIFGPGNQYVTAAKQLVSKEGIAIDMPAGPSEVAVYADDSAIPAFVASDLLSQAEHGVDSQVLLVTESERLVELVNEELGRQLERLPRRDIAARALENSKAILVKSQTEAVDLLNEYAAEHLILAIQNAEEVGRKIINAGSIFLGNYTPESAGDYASGTNHTLPTNGFAKAYSGVSLDSFVRKITFQRISEQGLRNIGPAVEAMAAAESLIAHKEAVSVRLDYIAQNGQEQATTPAKDQGLLASLLRPHIEQLAPYASARDEYSGKEGIFMDANENPLGSVTESSFNRYPDPYQWAVKEKLAAIRKVRPTQIFLGNGSDEGIDLLIRATCTPRQDNLLIMPPTYGMYEVSAAVNDVDIIRVPLTPETFQIDTDQVLAAVTAHTKLLFICSPNNPTGNLVDRTAILTILNRFSGLVVVDEAYVDFAPAHSLVSELDRYPNLIVLQTLSKAWGLASLRLGMAFASEEIIRILNKIKPPYNINGLTQQLVSGSLDEVEKKEKMVREILEAREKLRQQLLTIPSVVYVYPSDANFLLVKFTRAKAVFNYLLEQKIIVRDRSRVVLCEGCLRISVGSVQENSELLQALRQFQE